MGIHNNALIGASSQGYTISRSVRLRSSASAYFNRTPASASNRKTWTWSGWVKRGSLGAAQILLSSDVGTSNSTWLEFGFDAADTFTITSYTTDSNTTAAVFRDPSSWYHIVVAFDSTQATSANRCKIYVNGTQQTLTGAGFTLNADYGINNAQAHAIGYRNWSTPGRYFDGYLTEINFIDGQALTPSSFGETNAVTGVWQPKRYAGTYGTNGFYLNFSDNSGVTATTIGKDYSGNGNNWTPNNISITAGATYDSMLDSPTLYADGGNGRGNYATLNPLALTNIVGTFSNGNLQVSRTAAYPEGLSTQTVNGGKFYAEATITAQSSQYIILGVAQNPSNTASPIAPFRHSPCVGYRNDGQKNIDTSYSAYGSSFTTNDVIGIAVDVPSNSITFYKNGVSQGAISYTFSALDWFVGCGGTGSTGGGADTVVFNFGQRPFTYTPPTGFKALNTQNLPDATIKKGNAYFDATTYTGNGSTQSIVNSGSMQPDFIWFKNRSGANNHALYDSVRGRALGLISNATNAEQSASAGNDLVSFDTSGFSVGPVEDFTSVNGSAQSIIAWQWNAGGSTVTNTDGSISSQVRANPTAGFSVVTWTSTGANATIGHGLGVAPKMVIVKGRSAVSQWFTWHTGLTSGAYALILNLTDAQASYPTVFNSTTPTSSVFSVGTSLTASTTAVAYCFAAVAGYSAFGSYTGNGSTDGPFVFTGFRPRFVMFKRIDSANVWSILDSARDLYNATNLSLQPSSNIAEETGKNIDFLSNGFKQRQVDAGWNASGGTYIYAAFAENPFKNSLAR